MKDGEGYCRRGKAQVKPDVTMWMSTETFFKIFSGRIKAIEAFVTGKLKLRGDITKALKLSKILGQIRATGYFILPEDSKF